MNQLKTAIALLIEHFHKARRLDTQYDKPCGCTYEHGYECVNQFKTAITLLTTNLNKALRLDTQYDKP